MPGLSAGYIETQDNKTQPQINHYLMMNPRPGNFPSNQPFSSSRDTNLLSWDSSAASQSTLQTPSAGRSLKSAFYNPLQLDSAFLKQRARRPKILTYHCNHCRIVAIMPVQVTPAMRKAAPDLCRQIDRLREERERSVERRWYLLKWKNASRKSKLMSLVQRTFGVTPV